jgi:hypothetical protein
VAKVAKVVNYCGLRRVAKVAKARKAKVAARVAVKLVAVRNRQPTLKAGLIVKLMTVRTLYAESVLKTWAGVTKRPNGSVIVRNAARTSQAPPRRSVRKSEPTELRLGLRILSQEPHVLSRMSETGRRSRLR